MTFTEMVRKVRPCFKREHDFSVRDCKVFSDGIATYITRGFRCSRCRKFKGTESDMWTRGRCERERMESAIAAGVERALKARGIGGTP